jgi:hypothetical protein
MRSSVTTGPHPSVLAFLSACCVPDPAGVIGSAELLAALHDFLQTRPDLLACTQRELGLSLGRNRNLRAVRLTGGRRAWAGLRLARPGEAPVPVVSPTPDAIEAPGRRVLTAAERRMMRDHVTSTITGWLATSTMKARGTKDEASSTASDLYASLCAYSASKGTEPVTIQAMGRYLSNMGLHPVSMAAGRRGWYGIKPKPVDTTPTP